MENLNDMENKLLERILYITLMEKVRTSKNLNKYQKFTEGFASQNFWWIRCKLFSYSGTTRTFL